MDIREIRLKNLKDLMAPFKNNREFASHYGLTDSYYSYVSQILNGNRPFNENPARKLEGFVGKPEGWMDQHHLHPATETDTAHPISSSKVRGIGMAIETDSAGAIDGDQDIIDAVAEIMGEGVSTPTKNELLNIAKKAKDGVLTEEDVLLLGKIANRIENK